MRVRKCFAIILLFAVLAGCIGAPGDCTKLQTQDAKEGCYVINATSMASNGVSFGGGVEDTCQNKIVSNEKKDECYKSVAIAYASLGSGYGVSEADRTRYRKYAIDACTGLEGLPIADKGRIDICLMDIAKRMKDPSICDEVGMIPDVSIFSADFTRDMCKDMATPKVSACATTALVLLMGIVLLARS